MSTSFSAPAHGLFITFEGGEGAGKTTQIELLSAQLECEGYQVVVTREPGGTNLGRQIRQLLLEGDDVSARAEALLYAADRAHHVDTVIRPALNDGKVVLCDRYIDSSIAYQGAARSLGVSEVAELSKWATNGLQSNLTFWFDLDPAVGFARRAGTAIDRLEREDLSFHQAVRQMFAALAAAEPTRVKRLDATGTIDELNAEIKAQISPLLQQLIAKQAK